MNHSVAPTAPATAAAVRGTASPWMAAATASEIGDRLASATGPAESCDASLASVLAPTKK